MQHVLRNDREVMRWLIRQRWIAVGGQATAVLVAVFGFGMSFAFLPVAGGILLLAISNHFVVPESDHARGIGRRMGQMLAFDVGLLTWMLHWTGGGTNPFVLFYLLHVVLAAMFPGPRALGVILLAATAGYIWVTGFSPPFRETSAWVNDGQLVPELAHKRLARALTDRGHTVGEAWDARSTTETAAQLQPQAALLDLKLPTCNGIDLLRMLRASHPDTRILMLTGYGSIANAIEAVRFGAWDYLSKPADTCQILAALALPPDQRDSTGFDITPPSLGRAEWEHIQRVMADHHGNVSQAAEALGIHRRTLQRKLQKFPPSS